MGESIPRSAAKFVYIAADETRFLVEGQFTPPDTLEWLRFTVSVEPEQSDACEYEAFILPRQFELTVPSPDDPLEREKDVYWRGCLRRFAIDQAINQLDLGRLSGQPKVLTLDAAASLRRFAFRACDFQQRTQDGDLACQKGTKGDYVSTLRVCEDCGVPDPWERCVYVCDVATAVTKASGMVLARDCYASCHVGKQPAESAMPPYQCRWADRPPVCFTPREIHAPASAVASGRPTCAGGLLSKLNVAWNALHGYRLFAPVSFQPVFSLTSSCANASEYHYCVLALAELMNGIDEDALREELQSGVASSIQQGHSLSVLAEVLRGLAYPQADRAVGLLRQVYALRNLPPVHPPDWQAAEDAAKAAQSLGFGPHVAQQDWPRLWAATLAAFAQGLELILRDLEASSQ